MLTTQFQPKHKEETNSCARPTSQMEEVTTENVEPILVTSTGGSYGRAMGMRSQSNLLAVPMPQLTKNNMNTAESTLTSASADEDQFTRLLPPWILSNILALPMPHSATEDTEVAEPMSATIKRLVTCIEKPEPILLMTHIDYLNKVKELDPRRNCKYTRGDMGCGLLLADILKQRARYVEERKMWFVYDGTRWVPDSAEMRVMEMSKMVGEALAFYALDIKDEDLRGKYMAYAKQWQRRTNRKTYLSEAMSVYCLSMKELDANPYLLNCKNGTLDLQKMEFRPHNPDDKITKIADVSFDPNAGCPRFERFLTEVTSDSGDKSTFLQKVLGYALSGDTKYECMFVLYGQSTRNGKSTLMESVLRVLGEYGLTAAPETLMDKRRDSQGPSDDLARLAGVRLVNISEPSNTMRFNAALIKSLTGHDKVVARFLRSNSFEFYMDGKFFVGTNSLPRIDDQSVFESDRIYVIPFERHFTREEQDPSLKQLFAEEEAKSAILNWLLIGWKMLQEEGLNPPQEIIRATKAYGRKCDEMMCFMDAELCFDATANVRLSAVYDQYEKWCQSEGIVALKYIKFKEDLESHLTGTHIIARRRPSDGGEKTTLLVGYRLKEEEQNEV